MLRKLMPATVSGKLAEQISEHDQSLEIERQRHDGNFPDNFLPFRGDFMAASTNPASNCRDLGSWARPGNTKFRNFAPSVLLFLYQTL